MGSEGRLTAEAVSGALLKASASIDKGIRLGRDDRQPVP